MSIFLIFDHLVRPLSRRTVFTKHCVFVSMCFFFYVYKISKNTRPAVNICFSVVVLIHLLIEGSKPSLTTGIIYYDFISYITLFNVLFYIWGIL